MDFSVLLRGFEWGKPGIIHITTSYAIWLDPNRLLQQYLPVSPIEVSVKKLCVNLDLKLLKAKLKGKAGESVYGQVSKGCVVEVCNIASSQLLTYWIGMRAIESEVLNGHIVEVCRKPD